MDNIITFKRQLLLGVILAFVSCFISIVFKISIILNIAWILYGFLWIFHPVCPESYNNNKGIQLSRIGGIICVLIGLIVNFGIG